jgi:hypothetical protein
MRSRILICPNAEQSSDGAGAVHAYLPRRDLA